MPIPFQTLFHARLLHHSQVLCYTDCPTPSCQHEWNRPFVRDWCLQHHALYEPNSISTRTYCTHRVKRATKSPYPNPNSTGTASSLSRGARTSHSVATSMAKTPAYLHWHHLQRRLQLHPRYQRTPVACRTQTPRPASSKRDCLRCWRCKSERPWQRTFLHQPGRRDSRHWGLSKVW